MKTPSRSSSRPLVPATGHPRWGWILLLSLVPGLPWPGSCDAQVVQAISSAETTGGWGSAARLVSGAREGAFAVAFDPPGDAVGFLNLDLNAAGVDLSQFHALAFWWRVEGAGLRDFKIKVRNYPLAGGMEAVYTLHETGEAPSAWRLAIVELSKPQFDDWGGAPDLVRRYVTFRTEVAPGSRLTLFLDGVTAVRESFDLDAGEPVYDPEATSAADFDRNGTVDFGDFIRFAAAFGAPSTDPGFDPLLDLNGDGQITFSDFILFAADFGRGRGGWSLPVVVQSRYADSLIVALGTSIATLGELPLPPGARVDTTLALPVAMTAGRDPADTFALPLWAQVRNFPQTRAEAVAYLPQEGESRTWRQFLEAAASVTAPILPDFSYAGYAYSARPVPVASGRVFDVRDHGAVSDDGLSDQAAIQSAIDAATAAGGGVVSFPPGRFLINTSTDPGQPIYVRGSRVVLKGSGSREGGTVIHMINHLPPLVPTQLWTSPYMIIVQPAERSDARLAAVTADADRETFWIEVDTAARLSPGQRITLYLTSTQAVPDFLSPYPAEAAWTTILSGGVTVRERHSVAEISGRRVRLGEPLHTDVRSRYGWSVREYDHIEEVGVEDLCFMGSWREPFVHHKDAIHDGGWSALKLERVVNGWVRRCSFIDHNRPLHLETSSAISVYHITQAGWQGHSSIASTGGYGVFVGLSEDPAAHWHGPGTSSRSVGTVYWRYDMSIGQRIDAHGAQPYANLLDCVRGGILYGSGASIEDFPNHLRHYVLWNFRHGGSEPSYDFWRPGAARDRFVMPILVGLHGDPVRINAATTGVLESQGHAVDPESLFEAQLGHRLGGLPAFLADLRAEWETLRARPLPSSP